MHALTASFLLISILGFFVTASAGEITSPTTFTECINGTPLVFTKNMGQWNEQVLFRASTGGATMWFTKDGISYQFQRTTDRDDLSKNGTVMLGTEADALALYGICDTNKPVSIQTSVVRAVFAGADPNLQVTAEGLTEYRCNYFLGNDSSRWRTNVPSYSAIVYRHIYAGIDMRFSGDANNSLTYEYIAAPGVSLSQIRVNYEGDVETSIGNEGRVSVRLDGGAFIEMIGAPGVTTGSASPRLSILSDGSVGVDAHAMASDPTSAAAVTIAYSTFFGGSSSDIGRGIAVDEAGCTYITGHTSSPNYPVVNACDTSFAGNTNGSMDVFVTKFSATGNELVFSTFVGGSGNDNSIGLAIDASKCVYVAGVTYSPDFPTHNAFDSHYDYVDAFLTKLSATGDAIVFSTYLGGDEMEDCRGLALDKSGCAYVAGRTYSSAFPSLNAFDGSYCGNKDGFVTKFSATGSTLAYSTFLGGWYDDEVLAIAVDDRGSAFATGYSFSPSFPSASADDVSRAGQCDVFVAMLSPAGTALPFSMNFGGSANDLGCGIAVDDSGCVIVTGYTSSSDFPTANAYDVSYNGDIDAFVTKIDAKNASLLYSTYLGGSDRDAAMCVAVDDLGCAYVTGYTTSLNFPTRSAYDVSQNGVYDAFVTKLPPIGYPPIFSTYLGGGGYDVGYDIVVDGIGRAQVIGWTASSNFPTKYAYSPYHSGSEDIFVTVLSEAFACGDANGDSKVDLVDVEYLKDCYFSSDRRPALTKSCDFDCNSRISINDIVRLADYIFGRAAATCCQ